MKAKPVCETIFPVGMKRICAHCAEEAGQDGKAGETHGVCRRHFRIELAKILPMEIVRAIDAEAKPEAFCPDMKEEK